MTLWSYAVKVTTKKQETYSVIQFRKGGDIAVTDRY